MKDDKNQKLGFEQNTCTLFRQSNVDYTVPIYFSVSTLIDAENN